MSNPELVEPILNFVGDYQAAEDACPSVREIMEGVKVHSMSKMTEVLDEMTAPEPGFRTLKIE